MRPAGGTKSGLPCVVTRVVKSIIAFFAAPSFHEGSGSVWASVVEGKARQTITTSPAKNALQFCGKEFAMSMGRLAHGLLATKVPAPPDTFAGVLAKDHAAGL